MRPRSVQGLFLAVGALVLGGCGATVGGGAAGTVRCPPAEGEFPPKACAVVRGRAVDRDGRPIPALGVRVDAYVRELGYAYASAGALTDTQGRFELVVMRVNEFTPPATPDTATVEIGAVPGRVPAPGFAAAAVAPVRMRFAPMDAPVEVTTGDVVFALPR